MYIISQIPTLCNIRFVPENITLPEKYHYYPIDKEWYYQNIRDWQTIKRPYKQPIQQNDKQFLELHIPQIDDVQSFGAEYYIVDCDGAEVVGVTTPDFIIYDSGSVYKTSDGTDVPMAVCKWYFTFGQHELPDGVYRVIIKASFFVSGEPSPEEVRLWISEPLHVKEDHEDTVYIEAWNDTNKQDVIFSYDTSDEAGFVGDFFFPPRFGYRVHGNVDENPNTHRSATDFIEQDQEARTLAAVGEPTAHLRIGDASAGYGVPFYMRDMINDALKCDNIRVEGRRKVVIEGAEWEVSEYDNYPLYEAVIELQDYDRRDMFTDVKGVSVQLFEIPDYPFFVRSIFMTEVGNLINVTGFPVFDAGDLEDLEDFLNDDAAYFLGMEGTFAEVDGYMTYQNATGEGFGLLQADVLTEYFTVSCTTSSTNQFFKFYYDKVYGGIAWGDGLSNVIFANVGTNVTDNAVIHTYASAGTRTIYFFHNDGVSGFGRIRKLQVDGALMTATMTGEIGNNLPLGLYEINLRNIPNLGTAHALSLAFLTRIKTTIQRVLILNSGLTSITGTVFADDPYTTVNLYWAALDVLQVSSALSVSEVNSLVIDLYENTPKNMTAIDIRQTPPAAPTGTALTYCGNLVNFFGVIVLKD